MAASRARDTGPAGPAGPRALERGRRLNADTSTEPEGITRRVMINILEAFFRRPWLHLLPLFLLLVLGGVSAFSTTEAYRSVGTINATNANLITDITQQNQQNFSYETPATVTARQINERLRTDRFLNAVAEKAGLGDALAQGVLLRGEIRGAVSAVADGENLVRVGATTEQPQLSFELVQATIEAYRETVIAAELDESSAAEVFLAQQVAAAEEVLIAAEAALDTFAIETGGNVEEQTLQQQITLRRLEADGVRARERYTQTLAGLDAAKLAAAQTETVVGQRLQVQDEPEVPFAAEPKLRKAIMTMVLFGVVGVMLSLASVVLASTLDRTVRLPTDITGNFGLEVLAVVPDVRRR